MMVTAKGSCSGRRIALFSMPKSPKMLGLMKLWFVQDPLFLNSIVSVFEKVNDPVIDGKIVRE